jgi:hypothetical protein
VLGTDAQPARADKAAAAVKLRRLGLNGMGFMGFMVGDFSGKFQNDLINRQAVTLGGLNG